MNIYFDLEFTGLHQKTTPISLGMISDTNRTFYMEFTDFDLNQVDTWLLENVLKNTYHFNIMNTTLLEFQRSIEHYNPEFCTRDTIGNFIIDYLAGLTDNRTTLKNEFTFVGDCLAYDWVLFNEFFGGALKIPHCVNYIPIDICTMFQMKGIDPDVSRTEFANFEHISHNALSDACNIKACYKKLMEMP